ncbi:hypothetical protein K9M47_01915 [Candidatus Gracilibacteria bacterium]|nr:hypothetical protein [Candidatus Gracilibacteria bacterium]
MDEAKANKNTELVYRFDESESAEEIQRRVDEAFDVLFERVYKNYWIKLKQQENDKRIK